MNGDLEQTDEQWRLRFARQLRHSPETVWRAITEPAHLEAWFPDRIVGEWKVGSTLRFEARGGEHDAFEGEVMSCEYPSLLEFRWGGDIIRFEIVPDGNGCILNLIDTIDELGKAARDGAGWHACLDMLEHHLNGTTPPWTPGQRWADVHDGYVQKFGLEASTIGPPDPVSVQTDSGRS